MPFRIVPIVEGHGEVQAVPGLFRRLIAEFNPAVAITVVPPIRQNRGTLTKAGGIERAVELATISVEGEGVIFILLDSEGEAPCQLAPVLLARARSARQDQRISLVLAHQEFEAWFLAAASSLKGQRGLREDIEDHPSPESVRGCKEWLETWMPQTTRYSETVDQPAFSALFDLRRARRAPSFDKFCREIEEICREASLSAAH